MSARTDRIMKLTALIAQATSDNQPNRVASFTNKLASFEAMTDDHYDYLIALNKACLADPTLTTQAFYKSYYSKPAQKA